MYSGMCCLVMSAIICVVYINFMYTENICIYIYVCVCMVFIYIISDVCLYVSDNLFLCEKLEPGTISIFLCEKN